MPINEQDEQKKWKILRVVRYFLDNDGDIANIEHDTEIPLFEAEEYLHSPELMTLLGKSMYKIIQSKLKAHNKMMKILNVARCFLDNGGNVDKVVESLGISKSSAQRYLHDEDIKTVLGNDAFDTIQKQLVQNKKEGLSRGGKNYAANNDFTKDALGKFTGSKKK
jgi:hypothetical protein